MIDLVDFVKRIAGESEAAALGRARVVILSAAPQLVGWWDSARLQSTLANLIDNALKYNRYDRPVVVKHPTRGRLGRHQRGRRGYGHPGR
jgi:signal transduction histidine kinase